MRGKRIINTGILTLTVLGSLALLNVLSVEYFGRVDLTQDKQFTLSPGTRATLNALTDPVTIRAYFTKDLPAPYANNRRYVKDLLEEYYNHADGNLRYEFIDPAGEETSDDKEKKKNVRRDIFGRAVREATSVEKELRQAGIPAVRVRVNEDDKIEVKRGFMGIQVQYRDKQDSIPVVEKTAGLEYDLTTIIRKLSRDRRPKLVLATGGEQSKPQEVMQRFHKILDELYDLVLADLGAADFSIPEDAEALIVVGPATPIPDAARRAIDALIMRGRSTAFLLDSVKVDLGKLQIVPADAGLSDMLATYGVKVGDGLVVDRECAAINVAQQRFAEVVRYPFLIMPSHLDPDHPLTRGLAQPLFPFMAPLELALPEDSGIKAEVLVRSSAGSALQKQPYNLNPMQDWLFDIPDDHQGYPLLVALSGPIRSHYNKVAAVASDKASVDPAELPGVADNARVLVASGASFAFDDYLSGANETLILNLTDWLLLDEALLAVRSRGMAAAPVDEIDDVTRQSVKYFNIWGLPVLFTGVGLVRWRRRERRRSRVGL